MGTLFSANGQPPDVPTDEESEDGDEGTDDSLLGNPERFEPSLGPEVPSVDVPGASDDEDGERLEMFPEDVDPEVSRTFWRLVIVFDAALLALAVGPMFIYFHGDWTTGGRLLALGATTFAYGVYRYRRYRASRGEDSAPPASD